MTGARLEVVALAGTALVQDVGRALRTSGVPRSGAFDRYAHTAATGLVGGTAHEAALELVGFLEVRPNVSVTLAVTGEARVAIDGAPAPTWTAVAVAAGGHVSVRSRGCAYLAVAGGVQVESVLGSRSTCVMGPLGPRAVARGDQLPLAQSPTAGSVGDYCRVLQRTGPVRVVPGPHLVMPSSSVDVIDTSRIGVRVRPSHRIRAAADLPSLGVLPGAVQVLPSGDWIVLGPDSGTMGGYPVVGVVVDADVDRWAGVVPGDRVDLVAIAADAAPPTLEPVLVRVGLLPG
jgi:allophanate hydrolase subunit 2